MTKPRRKPTLAEGLARGVEKADVVGMADTIGKGLKRTDVRGMAQTLGDGFVRVSDAWLPRDKLAIPQACTVSGCAAGPYSSLRALRHHLGATHAAMSDRERSFALDQARRAAVRQAMNGGSGADGRV